MELSKRRFGHYIYGWFLWELISNFDLKINELVEIQAKEGYSACTYGFYCPKKYQRNYKNGKKEFKYTWQSSTTSD